MNDIFQLWGMFGLKPDPELQRQIDGITNTIKSGLGQALGVALPAMTIGAFARITDNMANRIEKLSNAGKSLNMGIGEIDKWTGAMEVAGVSADHFIGTLQNVNNQIREISRGQRPAMWTEAIRGWIPSADGYRGKNGAVRYLRAMSDYATKNKVNAKGKEQLYADMSQALTKMGVDGKTAYALLNGELDKYLKRAEKLGILTEKDEKIARDYLFTQRSVARAWTVMQTKIATALAPAFEFLGDVIVELATHMDVLVPAMMALVAPSILNGLATLSKFFLNPNVILFSTAITLASKGIQAIANYLEKDGFKRFSEILGSGEKAKQLIEVLKNPLTQGIAGLGVMKLMKTVGGFAYRNSNRKKGFIELKPKDPKNSKGITKKEGEKPASTIENLFEKAKEFLSGSSDSDQQLTTQTVNIVASVVNLEGEIVNGGGGNVTPRDSRSQRARDAAEKRRQEAENRRNPSSPPIPPSPQPQSQPKKKPIQVPDLGLTQGAGKKTRLETLRVGANKVTQGLKTGLTTVGAVAGGLARNTSTAIKAIPKIPYNVSMARWKNNFLYHGDWTKTAADSQGMQKGIATAMGKLSDFGVKVNSKVKEVQAEVGHTVNNIKAKVRDPIYSAAHPIERFNYNLGAVKEKNRLIYGGDWHKTAENSQGLQKQFANVAIKWNALDEKINSLKSNKQPKPVAGDTQRAMNNVGQKVGNAINNVKAKVRDPIYSVTHPVERFNYNLGTVKAKNRLMYDGDWSKTAANSQGVQKAMANAMVKFTSIGDKLSQVPVKIPERFIGRKIEGAQEYAQQFTRNLPVKSTVEFPTLSKGESTVPIEKLNQIADKLSGLFRTASKNVDAAPITTKAQQTLQNVSEKVDVAKQRIQTKVLQTQEDNPHPLTVNSGRTLNGIDEIAKTAERGQRAVVSATNSAERMVQQSARSGSKAVDTVAKNGTKVIQNLGKKGAGLLQSLNGAVGKIGRGMGSGLNRMFGSPDKGSALAGVAMGGMDLIGGLMGAKQSGKLDMVSTLLGTVSTVAGFLPGIGSVVSMLAGGAGGLWEMYKESQGGNAPSWATMEFGNKQQPTQTVQNNNTTIYVQGNADSNLIAGAAPGTKAYNGST